MTDIHALSLTELAEKLQSRELGVEQTVSACLERMDATEPDIVSLLRTERESALERAREMDASDPVPDQPLWERVSVVV
jgi:aspartyl-tRNA(Asn)/glutamyl-tRNA(Gln) amidotransferase subunit A